MESQVKGKDAGSLYRVSGRATPVIDGSLVAMLITPSGSSLRLQMQVCVSRGVNKAGVTPKV